MSTVESPVKDFTGEVAGVKFANGVASTDDPGALAYFRRKGYTVDGVVKVSSETVRVPKTLRNARLLSDEDVERIGSHVVAKLADHVFIGTPLGDAAEPGPLTMDQGEAGESTATDAPAEAVEDQGAVVPEVHGSQGVAPVKPGPVPEGNPQDKEADHVEAYQGPARNASRDAWVDYARSLGATDDELDGKSRDELAKLYGPDGPDGS